MRFLTNQGYGRCLAGAAVLGLGLLALGPIACKKHQERIRVGAITCSTGEAATLGANTLRGYELAVSAWNGKGGLLGKQIQLIHSDSKGDPTECAVAMTKAAERDQVVAVLGPVLSHEAMAAAPIAQRAGIPILVTATNPRVTAVGDHIFRVSLSDSLQGRAVAKLCRRGLGAATAACLFDASNDYSKGLADVFRGEFQFLGGKVLAFEGHPSGVADFHVQLSKILQSHPDVLFLPEYYGNTGLIARQARELGWDGQLVGSDGWDSPKLPELGGAAVEGGIYTTLYARNSPDPQTQAFNQAYRNRYGEEPDCWAAIGFDAGNILFEAIRRAGSIERARIQEQLEATDHNGATGRVILRKGPEAIRAVPVQQVHRGASQFHSYITPEP